MRFGHFTGVKMAIC